ncbi:SUS1 (YBR111W-A) [Zygosaccharomyces parabailii]|nr:SUS1 (YBR111W-A) [Zygosaccharomyces parabailii]AQZ14216.1 SUS1 (YBR111W-A) [Zygosaccharomyces parabailii]SJM87515.1 probable protein SUS1 [Zygosaccharomyces bailii]
MNGTAANNDGSSELKAQIQQYLVESGNYEMISNRLSERLLQEGWIDELKKIVNKEVNSSNSTNFTQILSKVEPRALEMVPDSTKQEFLDQIKAVLDQIVDTE